MIDDLMTWFARGGWVYIPLLFLVMSAIAFIAYWIDKSAAIRGDWRVRESTLHTLELLGGWPGALLAQRILHHKNRKPSYQAEFCVLVLVNVGVLAYVGFRLLLMEPNVEWDLSRIVSRMMQKTTSTSERIDQSKVAPTPSRQDGPRGSVKIMPVKRRPPTSLGGDCGAGRGRAY